LQILRLLPLVSEVTSSQNVNSSNNVTGGGVDYNSGPYTVMFIAGMTSASFNIPINDDDLREDIERFNITIDPSSLPSRVTPSSSATLTATILDDDCKCNDANGVMKFVVSCSSHYIIQSVNIQC